MKYVIILLMGLWVCSNSIGQKLDIGVKIDSCIDPYGLNKVDFIIRNMNDFDCFIKTNFLAVYFGIYASDGELVQKKSSNHLNRIGENEYTRVGKNSNVTITWLADFWDNFDFKINQEYYIISSYEYSHLTRKEKKKFKNSDFKLIK